VIGADARAGDVRNFGRKRGPQVCSRCLPSTSDRRTEWIQSRYARIAFQAGYHFFTVCRQSSYSVAAELKPKSWLAEL
jgi:hypothetical protein